MHTHHIVYRHTYAHANTHTHTRIHVLAIWWCLLNICTHTKGHSLAMVDVAIAVAIGSKRGYYKFRQNRINNEMVLCHLNQNQNLCNFKQTNKNTQNRSPCTNGFPHGNRNIFVRFNAFFLWNSLPNYFFLLSAWCVFCEKLFTLKPVQVPWNKIWIIWKWVNFN